MWSSLMALKENETNPKRNRQTTQDKKTSSVESFRVETSSSRRWRVPKGQNQPDQLNITNQWELEYIGFQRYRILEDISKASSMAANP